MSGYTSSYRSYESSRKLANGGFKVNNDEKKVTNGAKCEDNGCCVVRVEWNYRVEVSAVKTFLLSTNH